MSIFIIIFLIGEITSESTHIYDSFSKVSSYNAIVNDTKETQEFDYNVFHLKGESQSLMYNNAIVNSDSYIILNTDGIIKKGAIGTDLNQKSKEIFNFFLN